MQPRLDGIRGRLMTTAPPAIREAFSHFCWLHYQPRDGAIEVRDIGWLH